MRRARATFVRVLLSGVACVGLTSSVWSRPAQAQPTAIRAISVTTSGPNVVVTIEATGALPVPTSGVADGPPRVFFDFAGIALKAPGVTSSTDARIRRVRAGVHTARPLVTRVVLDLVAPQPYSLEREPGRVRVVVGSTPNQFSRGIAPVPPLPEPATPPPVLREAVRPPATEPVTTPPALPREAPVAPPAARPPAGAVTPPVPGPATVVTPSPSPTSPAHGRPSATSTAAPAKDIERYRRQISPALDRLRLQQPLLNSLDIAEDQTVDRVQLAVEEFERLRQELIGIKPPDSLRSQHDMLIQSTVLALMATRLRLEAFRTSDPATLRNAASAAAGATLLLDRVCADLGCPDSGR